MNLEVSILYKIKYGILGVAAPPPAQTPLHFRGAPPLELPIAKGCRWSHGEKLILGTCSWKNGHAYFEKKCDFAQIWSDLVYSGMGPNILKTRPLANQAGWGVRGGDSPPVKPTDADGDDGGAPTIFVSGQTPSA